MKITELLVRKDALSTTRIRSRDVPALQTGEVLLAVDRFALTANNITYAAFGDAMAYWQFFPLAPAADGDDDVQGWGCIPAWGFATVLRSQHPGVAAGERFYGYWPMASHAVLQPDRLSPEGFSDAAPHRAALHAVYNRYPRCSADPFHSAGTEDLQSLLRPLFTTAWLIDDLLADNAFFGAVAAASAQAGTAAPDATAPGAPGAPGAMVLMSSASSKTAHSTAARLARRAGIVRVGLSSPANLDFCRSLGCYDQVLAYEQLDQLPADAPAVYVDFAGNAALRGAVHRRFSRLAYSCSVGGTHVDQLGSGRSLPGPRPTLFFAPAQASKRHAEWGAAALGQRMVADWRDFLAQLSAPPRPWLEVCHHAGPDAVLAAYALVLAGRGDPRLGHMLSLQSAS